MLRLTGGIPLDPVAGMANTAETPADVAPSAAAPEAEQEVVLSPEAIERAGIKTAKVTMIEASASVQIPAIAMANAYREVKVTPLVGGVVTKVFSELGASVTRGTPLATIFSPELAEAQTRFLSMRAMFEADDKRLQRTQQLVQIGAASRQELEEVTAMHAGHATEVEAARQRLLLLGLAQEQVEALKNPDRAISEVALPAPIDGVITSRSANLGQVVGMGQELFVVTDLSEVWVVGDLYEQDFQNVHVGSEAVLTMPAYPNLTLRGQVSYIDPRVDPMTRTAKVRVEVPNPDGRLRLGMYLTMLFTGRGAERMLVVPSAAVQMIGDRYVVFVPANDEEGKFVQRTVQVGQTFGESCAILSGLSPGEEVVIRGSFFLRAESLRSG
jgi:RND family efflux transporter MFP subunit